jgi:hypothetical protein
MRIIESYNNLDVLCLERSKDHEGPLSVLLVNVNDINS